MVWVLALALVLVLVLGGGAGAECWKRAEYRGQGIAPEVNMFYMYYCPNPAYPELSEKRCYPKCESAGFVGTGALCWQKCAKTLYNGLYFCCESAKGCVGLERALLVTLPQDMAQLAKDLILNPLGVSHLLEDFRALTKDMERFRFPRCPKPASALSELDEAVVAVN